MFKRTVILIIPELWWGWGKLLYLPSFDFGAVIRLLIIPIANEQDGDRHAARFVLAAVEGGKIPSNDVLPALFGAACLWKDRALWRRVALTCGANPFESGMEIRHISDAILALGFDTVVPV